MSDSVTAAFAAAASAADEDHYDHPNDSGGVPSFSATAALVSYLRLEADLAEQRAKRLRRQAASLAEQFGITGDTSQDVFGERFLLLVGRPVLSTDTYTPSHTVHLVTHLL
jgi:hypothetical protein